MKTFKWRMKEQCDNCPFATSGLGKQLGESLSERRWREILRDLRAEKTFPCHKTVSYESDWEGQCTQKTRICAGSIEWQRKHGCVPQVVQVMERLEAMRALEQSTNKKKEGKGS